MGINSKTQISLDEKMLLMILIQNSGESIENIAKKYDINLEKILRIKKRLENNNTIWGYSLVADLKTINLKHFTVLFKRTNIPLTKEVIEDVTKGYLEDKYPEGNITIENALFVNGDYDWILSFIAPSMLSMKLFCEKLMHEFSDYIKSYSVNETVIPIRKQGIKNPIAESVGNYL